MESKKMSLNKEDLSKVGKGLAIALIGAALTHLTSVIGNVDFGDWTPLVVTGWSVLVNTLRKLVPGK